MKGGRALRCGVSIIIPTRRKRVPEPAEGIDHRPVLEPFSLRDSSGITQGPFFDRREKGTKRCLRGPQAPPGPRVIRPKGELYREAGERKRGLPTSNKKAPTFVGAFLLGFDLNRYTINSMRAGSSKSSFTRTKKLTLSFPSMIR